MTWFGKGSSDWQSERRRLIFMIAGLVIALVLLIWLFKYVESLAFPT